MWITGFFSALCAFALLLPQVLSVPAAAALVTPEPAYVSWESFGTFDNQRQALEIALSVAACLGEGTRLAVHDWRRSVYSLEASDDTAMPANATARPAAKMRSTSLGRPRARGLAAVLALRSGAGADLPFDLIANATHLRDAARAHGGVEAVPWSQVPPRARVLRLRMSAFCHYSCSWVRREVARQCPRGAVCALGPAAPSLAADGRVARADHALRLHDVATEDIERAGDAYSSVIRPGEGGDNDFYEDDVDTAQRGAAPDDGTSRTAYYVESSEHVVDDAAADLTTEAHAEAAHLAEHGAAAPDVTRPAERPLRRDRHAVVIVPLLDWGTVEAIFAADNTRPHNVLRPGARIAELARLLQQHLVAPAGTDAGEEGYTAAHISVGETPSYALYNCRLASRGNVPDAYVRVFTHNGVACQRRGTKGKAAADYLTVADVLRAHAFAPADVRRLYVATNAPVAEEIAALRVEAARHGVSLFTLSDLVRRAGPAAAAALAALERAAGDADAVRSMLNQQICSDARAYVATSVSSWDQYVLRERAAIASARSDARAALAMHGRATAAEEAAWRRADAAALADYTLYVQHERAWLATYACANEQRPGSALLMITFMLVSCVAMPYVRGAFTRLRELAAEARRRAKTASTLVFAMNAQSRVHGSYLAAPVLATRPLDTTRDAALALTLALAAYLVCVHGALMFLLEPLAATAHLDGARSGPAPARGPNVVAVLSWLRALTLAALAALVVLDVCVRAAGWRVFTVAACALTAIALYACSHVGLSAADFALARAPLPTLLTMLAVAVGGAVLVAVLVYAGARRQTARRARTSREASVRQPRTRPGAAAACAGAAVLALALRLCYVTEQWRIDDMIDLARSVLEVLVVSFSGAVLVHHDDADAGDDEREAGATGATLLTLDELEGTGAHFDRQRAERESDAALEHARSQNRSAEWSARGTPLKGS